MEQSADGRQLFMFRLTDVSFSMFIVGEIDYRVTIGLSADFVRNASANGEPLSFSALMSVYTPVFLFV